MAKPEKKSETKVTRITASEDTPAKKQSKKPPVAKTKTVVSEKTESKTRTRTVKVANPFAPIIRYVKGAWYELRQVRWPDRKATWGMTGALILFTLFFVIIILLLDAGFNELFKLIIGK